MERIAPLSPLPPEFHVPLGGSLRSVPEDFDVEELPLYEPSGEGEHLMLFVEKRGLTTPTMLERLAARLGARNQDSGWAGYKDRHAVTRQWVTLLTPASPQEALSLDLEGIRVLSAQRHQGRLRTGHLRANRFQIVLRGVSTEQIQEARKFLGTLTTRGLPNGFGPQRFGRRQDNHLLGEMVVKQDGAGLLRLVCRSIPGETPRVVAGRQALARGDWKDAIASLPREMTLELHLARVFAHAGSADRALKTLAHRTRKLLISAWQAEVFNRFLARRLDSFESLWDGDVAQKHQGGACFLVEHADLEAPRAEALEISPTGPLPGRRMLRCQGQPGMLENEVMRACGLEDTDNLRGPGGRLFRGGRRALRVPVADAALEEVQSGVVTLNFTLPAGSFATTLLACLDVHEGARPSPTES